MKHLTSSNESVYEQVPYPNLWDIIGVIPVIVEIVAFLLWQGISWPFRKKETMAPEFVEFYKKSRP